MDPIFGSETRARLLDQLAPAPRPQSAYMLARIIGAEPIQVLRILKQLGDCVERVDGGWVLRDDELRRFLLARSRRQADLRRAEKDELLMRFGKKPSYECQQKAVH